MDVPVPAAVPPHETEYQYQAEFTPSVPPVNVKVEDAPGTTLAGDAAIEVAAVEFTTTFALTQVVELHNPCALT